MSKFLIVATNVMTAIGISEMAYAENTWTRFYIGVDGGILINSVQLKSQQLGFTSLGNTCNRSSSFAAFSPGLQLGYMYQFAELVVVGLEANVTFNTNQKDTLSCQSDFDSDVYDRFTFRNRMQTSARGRIGFSLYKNTLLPYLIGGASFVDVALSYTNEGGNQYSHNNMKAGWLIGAGFEWAFQPDWSLRAEYYYADYGNAINLNIPSVYGLDDPNGNATVDLNTNSVLVSINYRL